MADHEATPFDPHEFSSAKQAVNTILWFGFPAEKRDRARAWLTAAVAYAQEREGMMTRRDVLDRFAEATVIADAEPENDAWGGVAMAYAAVLTGELPIEGMPGELAHALALAMNADRAQEEKP